mmetsp:Transcript_94659/g.276755  ORF Transcript_94659/g.276755 Transcript_94659/m.276755 type:complete len:205 (-) Transcript_94659:720-1334(-)
MSAVPPAPISSRPTIMQPIEAEPFAPKPSSGPRSRHSTDSSSKSVGIMPTRSGWNMGGGGAPGGTEKPSPLKYRARSLASPMMRLHVSSSPAASTGPRRQWRPTKRPAARTALERKLRVSPLATESALYVSVHSLNAMNVFMEASRAADRKLNISAFRGPKPPPWRTFSLIISASSFDQHSALAVSTRRVSWPCASTRVAVRPR